MEEVDALGDGAAVPALEGEVVGLEWEEAGFVVELAACEEQVEVEFRVADGFAEGAGGVEQRDAGVVAVDGEGVRVDLETDFVWEGEEG